MYKDCCWILIFLITSELTLHASCLEFINSWDPSRQRSIFFLNPSHNENGPTLNIQSSNSHETIRHSPSIQPANRLTRNRALGYASVTREVYAHPLKPVTRSELTLSSTRIVTKRPTSFDIPLRKSIRVSNNRPAIHTAGYLKETAVANPPYLGTTLSPKHTVFVDGNLKQSSAQTDQDVTSFDDSWRPKKLPTVLPSYKATTVGRPKKPIPFTRFSDAMATIEHRNRESGRRGKPSLSLLNQSSRVNSAGEPKNPRINTEIENENQGGEDKLSSMNVKNQKHFILKPTSVPKTNNRLAENFRKINHPVNVNQYSDNVKNKILKTSSDEIKIGVEYDKSEPVKDGESTIQDPSEQLNKDSISDSINVRNSKLETEHSIQNSNNKDNFEREDKTTENKGNPNISRSNKIVDENQVYVLNSRNLANHKESKSQNNKDSREDQTVTVNPGKLGSYVRYEGESSVRTDTPDKRDQIENNDKNKLSNTNVPSNINNFDHHQIPSVLFTDTTKEPEIPLGENFPKVPFYGEIIHQPIYKDSSREITEDRIYFPQIFPDSGRNFGNHRNSSDSVTTKQTTVHITKNNYVDKERLIEINPKENGKKIPQIDGQTSTYFDQPKASTISDYSSFKSPSLVTVSSDNADLRKPFDVILDPNRKKDKSNKTSNYVLERNPVLSSGIPGFNRPRKPNVRLTPGMLAGILIAALIFLGFLTGTMVFAFHQLKFGSRPKKAERHKKRTTVYAPEYLDENFSGNTYIHNNIFLPNPQNLEDRLSPDLDTSFSLDSEETAQVNDNHYPSTSSGNTRIKTTMQQRIHDGDTSD